MEIRHCSQRMRRCQYCRSSFQCSLVWWWGGVGCSWICGRLFHCKKGQILPCALDTKTFCNDASLSERALIQTSLKHSYCAISASMVPFVHKAKYKTDRRSTQHTLSLSTVPQTKRKDLIAKCHQRKDAYKNEFFYSQLSKCCASMLMSLLCEVSFFFSVAHTFESSPPCVDGW